MALDEVPDYYELLQISPNAEPETVHRVYRLLAQRVHPDNPDTGDSARFRAIHEAYGILSDPERRAQYDVSYHQRRQERWRLVSKSLDEQHESLPGDTGDFRVEHLYRTMVLEVLYTSRRLDPRNPGVFDLDLESLTGRPREHLEFTLWYLTQKKLIQRGDNSRLTITAEGVDYLEKHYLDNPQGRRLKPGVPLLPADNTSR